VCHHRSSNSIVVAVEAAFPAVVPGEPGSLLPSDAVMLEKCFLRLLDDTTFDTVASYALNNHEMTVALATYRLGGPSDSSESSIAEPEKQEYIVVGTAYVLEDEEEPSSGRVVVLQVKSDITGRSFDVVAEREVRGGVFSLGLLASGMIVAGVNSRVQVYNFVDAGAMDASASSASKSLIPICGFGGATLALYLDTNGDFILVGDLMKSISLLRYVPPCPPDCAGRHFPFCFPCSYKISDSSLEEVAAEPSCNWMTAVAMLDDSNFIGAEHHYNLFSGKPHAITNATLLCCF
jgi:DNA damage-binding protein 1